MFFQIVGTRVRQKLGASPWQHKSFPDDSRRSPDYSHSSNIPDSSHYTSDPQSSYLSSSQSETPFPSLVQSDCSTDVQINGQSELRDSVTDQSVEKPPVDQNIQISVMEDAGSYSPVEYFDENDELSLDSDSDFHADSVRFSSTRDSVELPLHLASRGHSDDDDDDDNDFSQSEALLQSHLLDSQSETVDQSCDTRNTLV